jgi:hypothetical protein
MRIWLPSTRLDVAHGTPKSFRINKDFQIKTRKAWLLILTLAMTTTLKLVMKTSRMIVVMIVVLRRAVWAGRVVMIVVLRRAVWAGRV